MSQLDDLNSAVSALMSAGQQLLTDLSALQSRQAALSQRNQQDQATITSLQQQLSGLQQQAAANQAEQDAITQAIGSIQQQAQQLVSGDQSLQASAPPPAASPNGNPTTEGTAPAPGEGGQQ